MTIRKGLVLAGIALAGIAAAGILVYQMLTSGRIGPMGLLLLAAVMAVMLPMVRAHYFPSLADCRSELEFHLQRQAVFVREQVADKLGLDIVRQIEAAPEPGEMLALMEKVAHRKDADLDFALQIIQSRLHEQAGDPGAAAASLIDALRGRPQDFLTRFRLARNLEGQGDRSGAIEIYRGILAAPAGLSPAMLKLTHRQMQALEES